MHYIELDEEMDMPCLCGCGRWFDLMSGRSTRNSGNKVVCRTCADSAQKIEDIEDEIERLEMHDNTKRQVKKLKKQLEELQNE